MDNRIKVTHAYNEMPNVTNIHYNNRNSVTFYIIRYPTLNCQLSSVGPMSSIIFVSDEDVAIVLQAILINSNKQLLLDINTNMEKKIFDKISKYIKEIKKFPYTNTTGSEMIFCIVGFDRDKIFKNLK